MWGGQRNYEVGTWTVANNAGQAVCTGAFYYAGYSSGTVALNEWIGGGPCTATEDYMIIGSNTSQASWIGGDNNGSAISTLYRR
jgi:hypothetical protein